MPLQPRHGYAAGFHRGLPDQRHRPASEFPARLPSCRSALQPSPDLPDSSWWSALEERSDTGSFRRGLSLKVTFRPERFS